MFLILTVASFSAFATDDEYLEIIPRDSHDRSFINPLSPEETYKRTQEVLKYYKSPVLPTGQDELVKMNNFQSSSNIKKLLKYFDMHNTFEKLFTLTSTELKGFEDFEGKTKQTLNVKVTPTLSHSIDLQTRIAQEATSTQPLRGLRVAIDPGHMGDDWDGITGKYVKDNNGNYLSEGVMALQTSLLLQSELKALGAQVVLTRTDTVPATNMNIKDLPVAKFAQAELLEQVYSPWFLKLLGAGTGNALFNAFDNSAERKKIWSEKSRANYFILKEDLWARADKINNFNPDIVLIIHFDVLPSAGDGHGLNAKAPNQTKVFVPGAYFDVEFGSRKARKQFAKKLLDQTQWDESIHLSSEILNQFKSQMGLTFPSASSNSIPVAPGIFARNLTLPRFIHAPATAYLECLFYNRPQEFQALIDTKHPMIINGVSYPYSDRLKQVVSSIKKGVLNYVQNPN
jgi:N-acetylmuramoyl-L-alanine amidase